MKTLATIALISLGLMLIFGTLYVIVQCLRFAAFQSQLVSCYYDAIESAKHQIESDSPGIAKQTLNLAIQDGLRIANDFYGKKKSNLNPF